MSNYGWGLPTGASSFAKEVDFGIYVIHGAMFLIFILWSIFFVYLLMRYRRRQGVLAQREHLDLFWSLLPDAIVFCFELFLIFVYAIPSWGRIKMRQPRPEEANVIDVVAEQFNWDIHYPGPDGKFGRTAAQFIDFANPLGIDPSDPAGKDDIVLLNQLHLPLSKPTLVHLSSKDVIHSFFIPEFRIKQDAVPGMRIPVWFTPTMAGHYEITCAQLCGVGHSIMRGDVTVHTPEDYAKWLAGLSARTQEHEAQKKAQAMEQW